MRIAMIGQRGLPASYGGVERHVEELSTRLADRGHHVVVFCRHNYSGSRQREFHGVELKYLPTISSKHFEAAVHSWLAAMSTVGRGFDVVHYHAVGPGLWSPISRWLTRAAVVQTIHGLDQDRAKWGGFASRVLRIGDWLSKRVPDAVIVVGAYLLDHYADRIGRTEHIPNGVTISTEADPSILPRLGLKPGEYLLFVGRLIPEKAVDQLIRAFSIVDTEQQLVIVGGSSFTDDYEIELKELARRDRRVVMPGYVYGPELAAVYANASAYVQPSILEGLPLTVLEAAAHGLPLILSDIPAHLEVLPDTRPGGILYPAGDVTALAEALAAGLATAKKDRAPATVAGAKVMKNYSWDAVADATESLYRDMISR